jgi:hypothetical protein
MLGLIALIGFLSLGRGLYKWQQKHELSEMCEAYAKLSQSGDLLTAEIAVTVAERLDRAVWTPSLRRAMAALSHADPSQRVALLESAAMELGFSNWACQPSATP